MVPTKRGVAGWLLLVLAVAVAATDLIHDPSGARLELAPVFLAAAVAAVSVRWLRTAGSRRRQDR